MEEADGSFLLELMSSHLKKRIPEGPTVLVLESDLITTYYDIPTESSMIFIMLKIATFLNTQ